MAEFSYDPNLNVLLSQIEEALVRRLPQRVSDLRMSDRCYALFIWYQDSSVFDFSPTIGLGTEAILRTCQAQYSDEGSRVDCLWRPQQTLDDSKLVRQYPLKMAELRDPCCEAYRLMLDANQSPQPLPDEGEILRPFRSMLYRVAAALNAHDWTGILNVDDAFVVVAVDSIGYWLEDDLAATIPQPKRDQLVQRGLLAS